MPVMDSGEIVAEEGGEMVVDEAEVEEVGETSEEVTSGVDLPATTMIVAHHHATTMIVDLPPGTTMTATLLL